MSSEYANTVWCSRLIVRAFLLKRPTYLPFTGTWRVEAAPAAIVDTDAMSAMKSVESTNETRPEMPSPLASVGSANARMVASSNASRNPRPVTLGAVNRADEVAPDGTRSAR